MFITVNERSIVSNKIYIFNNSNFVKGLLLSLDEMLLVVN